jgi:POT family proton-dependent oligopeptide transporter
MLSILALYMNETLQGGGLGFSRFATAQIYGIYIGLVYFTPFFGGIIADRWLGISKTIVIGGLFMMAGYFLLAFSSVYLFFTALVLIIIGNGCFKPNISVLLGNLYHSAPEKKDDGYNIFYMGINLGAFFSPIVAATLRNVHPTFGWHLAFSAAGVGMICSLIIFLLFRKKVSSGENTAGSANVNPYLMQELSPQQFKKRISTLLIIFGVVIFFWMAFHQNGLTLTFWANESTRTSLNPEIFQSVNPLFILIFTPLLVAFWMMMRRGKKEPSTAVKMLIGMLLTAGCYLIMAIAGFAGGDTGRVSVWWLISSYAIITLGELCLSPMGLSVVSKLAPWKIRSMMMGGWFVATSIGNYLCGLLGSYWDEIPHSSFFLILVGTSLLAAFILFTMLKFINPVIKEAEEMAIVGTSQKK